MKRILPTVVALAVLALCLLPGCAVSGGQTDTVQPPPDLPKIQAAKAYLDSTITRIKVDVAKVKAELPARVAAIEATVGPALATLEKLVNAYDGAALAKDIGAAESLWATVRTAVTTAVGALAGMGV